MRRALMALVAWSSLTALPAAAQWEFKSDSDLGPIALGDVHGLEDYTGIGFACSKLGRQASLRMYFYLYGKPQSVSVQLRGDKGERRIGLRALKGQDIVYSEASADLIAFVSTSRQLTLAIGPSSAPLKLGGAKAAIDRLAARCRAG